MSAASNERRRLKAAWPEAYADGEQCGRTGLYPGERERGGYPREFHDWKLDKRNAWFAGFNIGYAERKRATPKAIRRPTTEPSDGGVRTTATPAKGLTS